MNRPLTWWGLILLQASMLGLGFYLCIDGILKNSQTLSACGGVLLGVALVGIIISIEYNNNPILPSSPVIIVVEQENPTHIIQKGQIRHLDITGLDPCAV